MSELFQSQQLNRRTMLAQCSTGFGLMALQGLMASPVFAGPARKPHFTPRAKHVILCYMSGGASQVDTFDPKPKLKELHGKPMPVKVLRTQFNNNGNVMASPFSFKKYGRSGLPVSSLFPHVAESADELAVIRSLTSKVNEHAQGNYAFHTGFPFMGHPTAGAWMTYGLGTENANLPGYVVLCPGRPVRFSVLWNSAFLPAQYQGTYVNHSKLDPHGMIPNLNNAHLGPEAQLRQLALMRKLNQRHLAGRGPDAALEARLASMETAFRMQFEASEAFDLSRESESVREEYGEGHFANGCLLARRLAERGVRFTQVYYGDGQPWDTHRNHNELGKKHCRNIDRPIAALLTDLKRRGLLEDTLVIWGGEFGRTPVSENGNGRDHNHYGFSMFLAGGGVRGGMTHGETDEFGFRAVEDKVHVHDLHATIPHLLGLDHERLTYRYAGRDFRLTDVYGRVVREILA